MTIQRMDNVGIVVDDLKAAIAFFVELGLELEGETTVEGRWVDRIVGLDGVRSDIAMLRTPDGHSRLELSKFHTPPATAAEPNAPVNTLGMGRIMFAVDDIEDVLARLQAHGAELVGEVVQYEDQVPALLRPRPRGHHRLAEQLAKAARGARQAAGVIDGAGAERPTRNPARCSNVNVIARRAMFLEERTHREGRARCERTIPLALLLIISATPASASRYRDGEARAGRRLRPSLRTDVGTYFGATTNTRSVARRGERREAAMCTRVLARIEPGTVRVHELTDVRPCTSRSRRRYTGIAASRWRATRPHAETVR